MATIQYNGHAPSDYSQIGTSDYDDRWDDGSGKTEVHITARVMNSGNADGAARMVLTDPSTVEGEFGDPIATSGNWQTVRAGSGLDPAEGFASEAVILSLTYQVRNDRRMTLAVDVLNRAGGAPLASRSFTVNSYAIPRIASLSAGTIDIRVS